MRKIIITGSAPYFPEWWKENEHKARKFEIISINTSIIITKNACTRWVRSDDFYHFHSDLKDSLLPFEQKFYNTKCVHNSNDPTQYISWPFLYWKNNTGGTMLFNVLLEILNDSFWWNNVDETNIIGCDLIYKSGEINHFYGKDGTNDPMRLGIDCLSANLMMFKMAYSRMGIELNNLSISPETLLPFKRKILF